MESIYKKYNHNPSHLFSPDAKYFITGATYKKKMWFKSNEAKERLLKSINIGFDQHGWILEDWVILDNHYHLLGNAPDDSSNLPEMMKDIHKFVALWIKKNIPESSSSEKIMYNYWDTCITFEASYFTRLNYIWNNPVKHGYTNNAEEWVFGSYFKKAGKNKKELEEIIASTRLMHSIFRLKSSFRQCRKTNIPSPYNKHRGLKSTLAKRGFSFH